MNKHIDALCKTIMFPLRNIRSIRALLTESATAQLIHALVTSRLDYCNSLLYGIPDYLLKRLQLVKHIAARILTLSVNFCHIKPVLYDLHWLPVKYRIKYKILILAFQCLHFTAPEYLCDLVVAYVPNRVLHSAEKNLIVKPNVRTKTSGERCFAFAAAAEGNDLPESLRFCSSYSVFKAKLKTHFFTICYKDL